MKITMETDYAIRIIYCLVKAEGLKDARDICEETGVSFRFALKILRKLCMHGIVKSFRGVNGGYRLAVPPKDISLLKVFEATNGELAISKCLETGTHCSWPGEVHVCPFNRELSKLNDSIRETLENANFEQIAAKSRES